MTLRVSHLWVLQDECRLQMEAQHISLSQIHAAQLELLQEETDVRTQSLERQLQKLKDPTDRGEFICSGCHFVP